MPIFIAVGPGKTTTENPTFDIATKRLLDKGRRCRLVLLARERQPSIEVRLDGSITNRVLGTAALTGAGAGWTAADIGISADAGQQNR